MENNNKKLATQNLTRLATTKLCQPSENRKLDLQINNKPNGKNIRRRVGFALNSRNSNNNNSHSNNNNNYYYDNDEHSQRNNHKQQQQQQQQVSVSIKSRGNVEKRSDDITDANSGETVCNSAGNKSIHSNDRSGQYSANDVKGHIGGITDDLSRAQRGNGPIAGNLNANSSIDESTASAGLGEDCKAAGESIRGSAAFKKSTSFAPELNSVFSGRKKQNHNHLLNFHYASLDVFSDYHDYSQRNTGGSNDSSDGAVGGFGNTIKSKQRYNYGNAKKYTKYNKEIFLQANFQFVIRVNAKPNFYVSPDTLICWDAIEQINIQTTEEPRCPICLYPPVAAKLTRCGHAYCWPCILHYLALSDKTWRKCPICFEAVHIGDLKSTAIMQQQIKNVNDTITLQLMHRQKNSLYIEKFQGQTKSVEYFPFLYEEDEGHMEQKRFSKFLLARRTDIFQIIEREKHELSCGMDNLEYPEFTFVQQALALLQTRRDKLGDKELKFMPECVKKRDEEYLETEVANPSKYYHLYQSVDGQNIYLHALNIKMLQMCYGSLDLAPPTIEGRILQMEHFTMDEHIRKKFSCLAHLPITRQFAVVELDLKPPIITSEVIQMFYDDISYRKKERQRRQCEEVKREKKINEFNDRQMGKLIHSTANLNFTSNHEFPTCGFDIPLVPMENMITTPTTPPSTATYSAALVVGAVGGSMNNTQLWPELASGSVTSAVNTATKSAWGIKMPATAVQVRKECIDVQSTAATAAVAATDDDDFMDGDQKLSSPFHNTLSDVVTEAISQRQQKNAASKQNANKKNKRNKKMQPLFTTGMNFNGN